RSEPCSQRQARSPAWRPAAATGEPPGRRSVHGHSLPILASARCSSACRTIPHSQARRAGTTLPGDLPAPGCREPAPARTVHVMRNRVTPGSPPLEQELARAWRALPPGQEVCTADGRRWQVIYPGRPNPEAGPDFVDAIFATEGGELRGDVELHRRTSDWRRHGHDADRRYRRVVLHVVAAHDGEPSLAPGGRQLPLLELDPVAFQQPPGSLAPVRFPCAARTLAGSAGDRRAMLAALAAAGDARFDAAAARFGT